MDRCLGDHQVMRPPPLSSAAPGMFEVVAGVAADAAAAAASVIGAGDVEDVGRPTTIRTLASC